MLDMCLNATDGFPTQDALNAITAIAYNPIGRYMAFNFIREKWMEMTKMWEQLIEILTLTRLKLTRNFSGLNMLAHSFTSFHSLARVFETIVKPFNTDMELKEVISISINFLSRDRESRELTNHWFDIVSIVSCQTLSERIRNCLPARLVRHTSQSIESKVISTGWRKTTNM